MNSFERDENRKEKHNPSQKLAELKNERARLLTYGTNPTSEAIRKLDSEIGPLAKGLVEKDKQREAARAAQKGAVAMLATRQKY